MATVTGNTNIFGTNYTTSMHHTEATTFTSAEIDAAKIDRFYIELSGAPESGPTIVATGSMTFSETGSVQSNAFMDSEQPYTFTNDSSAHLEGLEGPGFGAGDLSMIDSNGDTYDASNSLRLFGFRFDSYEGVSDGSPVMGYFVSVINSATGVEKNLFFPTSDQNLSNVILPAIGESLPANTSVITHVDEFNGMGGTSPDYDENDGGTYISYVDLTPAHATQAGDYTVTGTDSDDLIDTAYLGDPEGDLVDNNDGNPNSPGVGDDDSIVAGAGDDTIVGGLGNDTLLGGAGDDVFELAGDNYGADSIVGGEEEEIDGDTLDLSGATVGVSVDMSAGTGESGSISGGASGSSSSSVEPTSDPNGVFDPNDLFGSGNGQVTSTSTSGHGSIEHIVVDGKDYVALTGGYGKVQFFRMDPDTGALTSESIFDHSTSHSGNERNTEVIESNGKTFMYVEGRYGYDVYSYNDTSEGWEQSDTFGYDDLGAMETAEARAICFSSVYQAEDGNTYLYHLTKDFDDQQTGEFSRFLIDTDTGVLNTDSKEVFGKFELPWAIKDVDIVVTNDGPKFSVVEETTTGTDHTRLYNLDANGAVDGNFLTPQLSLPTNMNNFNYYRNGEPFVDANGNIIYASGHDSTSKGGYIHVYDASTDTTLVNHFVGNFMGAPAYSIDCDGNIYITTTSSSGGGATTRPYTVVISGDDYSVVEQGYDTDGGYIGNLTSSLGYRGAENNEFITSSNGEHFLVQSSVQGSWITTSTSELAGVSSTYGQVSDDTSFEEIENLVLTDQDDELVGSIGNENINAGAGNDTIDGGDGADTIAGGLGDDSINLGDQDGDADVVVLADGDGNDTIEGVDAPIDNGDGTFTGVDTLDVSGVTDPATGEPVTTDDVTITVDAVTGDPTLAFPDGTSVTMPGVTAPSEDPSDPATANWLAALGIPAAPELNYIVEGTDAGELIDGNYDGDPEGDMVDNDDNQTGNNDDNIDAGAGNDTVISGQGDDTVLVGEGDDVVEGGAGNDAIYGQEDNDTLEGGVGNDTLDGGTGDDILTGGQGNDTFTFEPAGNDSITDFGSGITGDNNNGDQSDNDFVDLNSYYEDIFQLRADQADDGILNQSDRSDYSEVDEIAGSLTLQGVTDVNTLTFDNTNVPCFVRGSWVHLRTGITLVEDIKVGDQVITRDNGFQTVRWVGSAKRPAVGKHAPILFKEGSIGNSEDLMVSPNHRILVQDSEIRFLFDQSEVLVAAKFMVNGADIVAFEAKEVEYIHFMFDQHEIVQSHGIWSESFYPGEVAMDSIDESSRNEILDLFPELVRSAEIGYGSTARQVLRKKEVRLIENLMSA